MGIILDGKSLSEKILDKIKTEIEQNNYKPTLAVILVGNDSASQIYVSVKEKACKKVGIKSITCRFDEKITENELLNKIDELNNDNDVDAILVQLPLPKHIDKTKVINKISPNKDVDSFTYYNTARVNMALKPYCYPCTPKGIIRILDENNIKIEGKHAVVIGRSDIVGKPVSSMLLNRNATVTICHSKTLNLPEITKQADILISAIGKPYFITKDMVKENAVVIDVGISRVEGKLKGDVNFEDVFDKVSHITPVPKGVGPMTIASLIENTLELHKQKFLYEPWTKYNKKIR